MPKRDDVPVYPAFDWQYLNGKTVQCHVVIRQQKTGPAVYLLEHKADGTEDTAAYFLYADELDNLINALKAAQSQLTE